MTWDPRPTEKFGDSWYRNHPQNQPGYVGRRAIRDILERNIETLLDARETLNASAAEAEPVSQELPEEYLAATRRANPRALTWDDIIGNANAVAQIREAIDAAKAQGIQLPHMLLFGPPGMGKTTIAKITATSIGGRFFETTASTLETQQDVFVIFAEMNEARVATGYASTIFVDEIHMLGQARGRLSVDMESIYPLLEDWQFHHSLMGKSFPGRLDGKPQTLTPLTATLPVWPFTCIGATTEPGMLSQAMLRRFLIHIELQPYSEEDIIKILLGSARRMSYAMDEAAGVELAKYARRNPGRCLQLLTSARNRIVAQQGPDGNITEDIAREVIERMGLYPLGLTETDVKVLRVLSDRPKGVGQAEICRAVGISQSQFSGMIEPYLRLLNFVETLSRRVIRPEGLVYLARLGKIDASRPEIRAALAAAEKAGR